MVYGAGEGLALKYLKEGTLSDFKTWGHGYLHHLAKDISTEYNVRIEKNEGFDDLYDFVDEIVPVMMLNNAEHDACDLLMEVDRLEHIQGFVNEHNYQRVILYLNSCSAYSVD